jgi:hypothetical protein
VPPAPLAPAAWDAGAEAPPACAAVEGLSEHAAMPTPANPAAAAVLRNLRRPRAASAGSNLFLPSFMKHFLDW